ncbi:hypothetical protein HT031_003362 [Scenedesmus sp. PABB004]|nr:hypothetical protein HT031_003362 [Scenedesmus sp. PABB004]
MREHQALLLGGAAALVASAAAAALLASRSDSWWSWAEAEADAGQAAAALPEPSAAGSSSAARGGSGTVAREPRPPPEPVEHKQSPVKQHPAPQETAVHAAAGGSTGDACFGEQTPHQLASSQQQQELPQAQQQEEQAQQQQELPEQADQPQPQPEQAQPEQAQPEEPPEPEPAEPQSPPPPAPVAAESPPTSPAARVLARPQTVLLGSSSSTAGAAALQRLLSAASSAGGADAGAAREWPSPRGRGVPRINAAVALPSLDGAAVARSLVVHYVGEGEPSLPAECAALVRAHCAKLGAAHEAATTALDICCGVGGAAFELALSFSHVLGVDGDSSAVRAAKALKETGEFTVPDGSSGGGGGGGDAGLQGGASQPPHVARVSKAIDRDKVRFWQFPLPDLPPKLQPVDAVLVEAADGRLEGAGLEHVLEQVPSLLNPEGVCVVALPAGGDGGARMAAVRALLEERGLAFVEQRTLHVPAASGGGGGEAGALGGVWLQPAIAGGG